MPRERIVPTTIKITDKKLDRHRADRDWFGRAT